MRESEYTPDCSLSIVNCQLNEGIPFITKVSHKINPVNVMALIQSNRNIGKLLRKETDVHKKQLLTNIMKANTKIIVSL